MAEEQQERTEDATAKRREDFRRKGQVAQSREVHTAALMTSCLLLWFFYAPVFWQQLQLLTADLLRRAGTFEVTPPAIVQLFMLIFAKVLLLLSPLLLPVLVIGTSLRSVRSVSCSRSSR